MFYLMHEVSDKHVIIQYLLRADFVSLRIADGVKINKTQPLLESGFRSEYLKSGIVPKSTHNKWHIF